MNNEGISKLFSMPDDPPKSKARTERLRTGEGGNSGACDPFAPSYCRR